MSQPNITEKGDSDTTNFHESLKSNIPTDLELEEILNDAVGDFEIQTAWTQTGKEVAETDTKSTGTDEDVALLQNKNESNGIQKEVEFDLGATLDTNPANNIDIEYVDKLLSEFQHKMNDFIEDTLNNDPLNLNDRISENNKASTEEIQKRFCKMAQDTMNSLINEGLPQKNCSNLDDSNQQTSNNSESNKCTDFKTVISQAIKNLCENSEELNDGLLMSSSDDIAKLLNDLTFNEGDDIDENEIEAHFMKIFIKIGQTVLYPPLKEMCEKYPTYLKNNKAKLSKESYDNYEKQLTNIVQVCKIFEEDVEEGRHHKFQKILTIMQEIQNCGLPPEELVQGNPFQLYDNVVSGIYSQDIKNPQCTIL